MTNPIEELRRAHEATTQGEWAYRPQEYDDWGVVRSGRFHICQARDPRYANTDYLNQCRVERRDPWEANARFIALAHREWPALLDRIEALEAENARLREALQPFAKSGELLFRIGDSGRFWAYRPAGGDEYGITGTQLLEARTALGDPT